MPAVSEDVRAIDDPGEGLREVAAPSSASASASAGSARRRLIESATTTSSALAADAAIWSVSGSVVGITWTVTEPVR